MKTTHWHYELWKLKRWPPFCGLWLCRGPIPKRLSACPEHSLRSPPPPPHLRGHLPGCLPRERTARERVGRPAAAPRAGKRLRREGKHEWMRRGRSAGGAHTACCKWLTKIRSHVTLLGSTCWVSSDARGWKMMLCICDRLSFYILPSGGISQFASTPKDEKFESAGFGDEDRRMCPYLKWPAI